MITTLSDLSCFKRDRGEGEPREEGERGGEVERGG